jgi:hypothetical protein
MESVMNDDQIRKILEKDICSPKSNSHEWSSILKSIEAKKKDHWFNLLTFKPLAVALASFVIIITISFNHFDKQQKELALSEQSLLQLLTEDNYLAQGQETYAWVDSY